MSNMSRASSSSEERPNEEESLHKLSNRSSPRPNIANVPNNMPMYMGCLLVLCHLLFLRHPCRQETFPEYIKIHFTIK